MLITKNVLQIIAFMPATAVFAATRVHFQTSCGYEIDLEYGDCHTMKDVINDALILEDFSCVDRTPDFNTFS
jgi:hypothetical protein